MMMYCFHRCLVDIMTGGGSPYFLRCGEEFRGPIIPFGADCTHQPASPKDKERLQHLGEKRLRGIITGYKQRAGGGWTNELQFVDWEELEEASSPHDAAIKSMHHKEITIIKTPKGDSRFPLAEGALSQPGSLRRKSSEPGGRRFRRSPKTLLRIPLILDLNP